MNILSGHAWVFGDAVNTDVMAPGLFFKAPIAELAMGVFQGIEGMAAGVTLVAAGFFSIAVGAAALDIPVWQETVAA